MLPTISIVTPSYNQAAFVPWTVRSVLLQRYPNLEYVLMDGGSDDGSLERLEPYLHHFHHWQSRPDEGQGAAIADGFEHTSGEIMAWLNSDDMLAPGALHWVARYFADHPDVDVLYSHRCMVDDANTVISYWILPRHSSRKMLRWDLIPQETCFWRRSLYERCGPVDRSFRFAMDYDLFARFMLAGRMVHVPRVLGVFRQHELAKTSQQMETVGQEEVRRVHERYDVRFSRLDGLIGRRFWHGMLVRSAWHVRRSRTLPGALPGIGYDYDEVWGGLLNEDGGAANPEL